MLNRFFSVLGACGLTIVLTGIVPMTTAYASGSDCGGTGCAKETDGTCKRTQPDGACTGQNCGCKTTSSGCACR